MRWAKPIASRSVLTKLAIAITQRGAIQTAVKQPTCVDYCTFMDSLATMPYAVQTVAFWAIEYAYSGFHLSAVRGVVWDPHAGSTAPCTPCISLS